MKDWDKELMKLAEFFAEWSKDPSTKVGAVIVDDLRRVVGTGYNGFPRGVDDDPYRYQNRDIKYRMVVHAEVNAILNSVKEPRGCAMYCTFRPCARCAALIIQSGIKTVYVRYKEPDEADARWKDDHDAANEMFYEADVNVVVLGEPDTIDEEIPF